MVTNRHHGRRRGLVLILVLLAVAIAFVVGLGFLASSVTTTASAETLSEHAQARRIAEAGLDIVVRYVEQTPNWRTTQTTGTWMSDFALHGGAVTVDGAFTNDPSAGSIAIGDPSFESSLGQLANPLFFPPMSGNVGGWQLDRTSALEFGPTVPRIGVMASASATDGSYIGFVNFLLAVDGTGMISQDLGVPLTADADYELTVDVGSAGIAALLSTYEVRILAGATLLASSADPSVLTLLDIDGDFAEHTIRFGTGSSPPAGNIRIELYAESLAGAASGVAFDNVRLAIEDTTPLILTVDRLLRQRKPSR